jgi:hypothetical protein
MVKTTSLLRVAPALAFWTAIAVVACGGGSSSGGGSDAGSDQAVASDTGTGHDATGGGDTGGGADTGAGGGDTGTAEGGSVDAPSADAPQAVDCLDGGACGKNELCCTLVGAPTYGKCYNKACLACCQ